MHASALQKIVNLRLEIMKRDAYKQLLSTPTGEMAIEFEERKTLSITFLCVRELWIYISLFFPCLFYRFSFHAQMDANFLQFCAPQVQLS